MQKRLRGPINIQKERPLDIATGALHVSGIGKQQLDNANALLQDVETSIARAGYVIAEVRTDVQNYLKQHKLI
jgi:hypothetical protein